MKDASNTLYEPPGVLRECKFSIRLNAEDHIRLVWWAENCATDDNKRRAEAARYAIQQFLARAGVPSAGEIIKARHDHD